MAEASFNPAPNCLGFDVDGLRPATEEQTASLLVTTPDAGEQGVMQELAGDAAIAFALQLLAGARADPAGVKKAGDVEQQTGVSDAGWELIKEIGEGLTDVIEFWNSLTGVSTPDLQACIQKLQPIVDVVNQLPTHVASVEQLMGFVGGVNEAFGEAKAGVAGLTPSSTAQEIGELATFVTRSIYAVQELHANATGFEAAAFAAEPQAEEGDVPVSYLVINGSRTTFTPMRTPDFYTSIYGRQQSAYAIIMMHYGIVGGADEEMSAHLAEISYRVGRGHTRRSVMEEFYREARRTWPNIDRWKTAAVGDSRPPALAELWTDYVNEISAKGIRRAIGRDRSFATPLSQTEAMTVLLLGKAIHGMRFASTIEPLAADPKGLGAGTSEDSNWRWRMSVRMVVDQGMSPRLQTYMVGLALFAITMLRHAGKSPKSGVRLFNAGRAESLVRQMISQGADAASGSNPRYGEEDVVEIKRLANIVSNACIRQLTGLFEALMDILTDGEYSASWPNVVEGVCVRPTAAEHEQMLAGEGLFQRPVNWVRPPDRELAPRSGIPPALASAEHAMAKWSTLGRLGRNFTNTPVHYMLFAMFRHGNELNFPDMEKLVRVLHTDE